MCVFVLVFFFFFSGWVLYVHDVFKLNHLYVLLFFYNFERNPFLTLRFPISVKRNKNAKSVIDLADILIMKHVMPLPTVKSLGSLFLFSNHFDFFYFLFRPFCD